MPHHRVVWARLTLLAAIAALAAQVGAWRMQAAEAALAYGKTQVQRFGGAQEIRGLVADEPAPRAQTTSLTLSNVFVLNGSQWEPLGAKLLTSVPHWPSHEYGEYLQLRGTLRPLTGGGAIEALGRQGVLASMSYPKVSDLANPQANGLLVHLSRFRQELATTIGQTLPEPAASTLQATLLGLKGALPKDEQQALIDTGTVHLVAISGYKLSLLAAMLEALGLWILRKTTARLQARAAVSAAVLATIAGYTALTGATPSALRAAVMAGLVVLAALAGRPRDQLAALAIAVLAIVGLRPFELQDGGFQLSCLSVLGIALLAEPLASVLAAPVWRLPASHAAARLARFGGLALAEALAASVAATAFDVPVLAGSFHEVSLVSPLANLLGMPLLGPIMALGGAGALLGSLWSPLGALLLWPAWAFTTLLGWIVHWTAGLPHAALAVDGMPPAAASGYFALLLAATWWLGRSRGVPRPKQATPSRHLTWAALAGGVAGVAALTFASTRPPQSLRATLLAVPGQAALIQTPAGRTVLVDGGRDGAALLRQLGQLLPPWSRGLDVVVVTSPRVDHIGALDEVLARYAVGTLLEPRVAQPSATFRRLQVSAPPRDVDQVDLGDGAVLRRTQAGWRLEQGDSWLLMAEQGFDLSTPEGNWHVRPMLGSAAAAGDLDLALAETGNVTVSFPA